MVSEIRGLVLLSHCCERLQLVQNHTILRPNETSVMDVPTLVFISVPKISLPKMCGKAHYHRIKPTCAAKDFVFSDGPSEILMRIVGAQPRLKSGTYGIKSICH